MALKDPILQQGFEIICKNLVELEKENEELEKAKNKSVEEELEYAKIIIQELLKNSDEYARQRAIDYLREE